VKGLDQLNEQIAAESPKVVHKAHGKEGWSKSRKWDNGKKMPGPKREKSERGTAKKHDKKARRGAFGMSHSEQPRSRENLNEEGL